MKNFRKIASVMLVLILAVALVGCSNAEKKAPVGPSPSNGPAAPSVETNAEVEAFVDEYGSMFADSFEEGFSSSGLTCNAEASAVGSDFVLDVYLDGIDNVSSSVKSEMQSSIGAMGDTFVEAFRSLKSEVPSLEGFVINIYEEDGDYIASIARDI